MSPVARPRRSQARAPAWSRYRGNAPRHLIAIARDLQTRALRELHERGFEGVRPSFTPLLTRLWQAPRPLTALAAELAISAQACSQLVGHVEAAGYLERRRNPDDARSRVARLTPRGRALVEESVQILLACDREYASHVGAGAYQRFTTALAVLYRGLGLPVHADSTLIARGGRSAGVLPVIASHIEQQLLDTAIARGHAGLKMSHGAVLQHLGPHGARIHEIARIQRVSRQATHATARELEALGYVRRRTDTRDRRGGALALTERGARLIADSVAAIDALEGSFRAILGERRFALVERVASDLYASLALGASAPAAGAALDIEQLAERLRGQLGAADAARLAALL
ncbi:MAG TPA: MarR family transcriptional regulator [Myxococcota bacterium]|nr:MarR family transcriptional regulator [Myxococcota bacterium]